MRRRSLAALLISSCGRGQGGSTTQRAHGAPPANDVVAAVPLGDVAGAASSTEAMRILNPYSADPTAIQEGHQLFIKMNCAGCHGYGAKGAMGPDLTDAYWRYGGVPVAIYRSIHDGRPKGMPAWNPALPPSEIWKLVGAKYSLPLSHSVAASAASAGSAGRMGLRPRSG